MNLNQVTLVGRLTRDPELKALPSGVSVCQFSVATGRYYKDKDGKPQEETEYHNIAMFGTQADNAGKYLVKGQLVTVVGRLKTRSWEKDGQKHYKTDIIGEVVQFGPKPGGSSNTQSNNADEEEWPEEEINPEDIPF